MSVRKQNTFSSRPQIHVICIAEWDTRFGDMEGFQTVPDAEMIPLSLMFALEVVAR